jgi:3-keto-5-aminohexanoate cleavage enzyme
MRMTDELIVNLCPTGMVPTRMDSPHVPLTPDEVAADVRRCADAGASIVHLHPRDNEGRPSQNPDLAAEFIRAVRSATPEIVICITTSGRVHHELADRVKVLDLEGDARPEMASLTLGSLNFPKQASISSPETIQGLAQAMQDRGVVPEWEIFDFGMLDYAHYLRDRGLLPGPVYANLLLGSLGALAAKGGNVGGRRHWPLPVRGEQVGHRDGWWGARRARGQPMVRRRPHRSRVQPTPGRAAGEDSPSNGPRTRDAGART